MSGESARLTFPKRVWAWMRTKKNPPMWMISTAGLLAFLITFLIVELQ